jgi:hypothetical protein
MDLIIGAVIGGAVVWFAKDSVRAVIASIVAVVKGE